MNCCLQNMLHINLHILYIIYFKTSSKIQKLLFISRQIQKSKIMKIKEVHQKIQTNQFILFYLNCFPFEFKGT